MCRSAGDFESSWDLCTSSVGDLVPYSHTCGSEGSITTRHFINHIGLCYSHKVRYIIIWHVLSKSLYIYTTEIQGWQRWTQRRAVYIWDTPGLIYIISLYKIQTLSFPALGLIHCCRAFIDPPSLAIRSWIHAICVVHHGRVFLYILWPCSYAPRARTPLSHEISLRITC